jgi:DNA-binding LacI/PurR family transcriptional regulator/DNA-binding transcriptional regulator YhcF (GntR family)
MRPERYTRIAGELEARLKHDPAFVLGSISQLAKQWEVSYPTMHKAAHVLARKGLLKVRSGRKISLSSASAAASRESLPDPESSAGTLFERIRKMIAEGDYAIGGRLPKQQYFALTDHISPQTVTKAYQRLVMENLVYKKGRRFIVGPQPRIVESMGAHKPQSPVALFAIPWTSALDRSLVPVFNQMAINPMISTLTSYGVNILPVGMNRLTEGWYEHPTGWKDVRSEIKRLGGRYAGAIIHSIYAGEAVLAEWVRSLLAFQKPVVYLDIADKDRHIVRDKLSHKGGYFRLHYSEEDAVRMALATLAQWGHARIGLHAWELHDWTQQRAERVVACAAAMPGPVEIVKAGPVEDTWKTIELEGLPRVFDALADQSRIPDAEAFSLAKERFFAQTRSFSSLFAEKGATAILALNDQMAHQYYFWLKLAGMSPGKDLSLLSFDNEPGSVFFPVSSIDFGLARLGHLAAHIIIGDTIVRADRHGCIPGVCRLVDRGSLGPPGRMDKTVFGA